MAAVAVWTERRGVVVVESLVAGASAVEAVSLAETLASAQWGAVAG